MFDDRPDFAKRLQIAREKRGFDSARAAAKFFGWNYDTYIQHERGERGLHRAAKKYATAFRVSEGWLLTGEGEGPSPGGPPATRDVPAIEPFAEFEQRAEAMMRGEAAPPRRTMRVPYAVDENVIMEGPAMERWAPPVRDIEELGIGVASVDEDESAFEFNGQVVDRVVRPPGLLNRPGVFALRVANLSMWPKFRDGERIYVDAKKPAIEDFVVVELKPTEEGRPGKAFVKMLVGRDARKVVVEQFNPAGRLEFSHDEILRVLRVIPTEELWG